MKIRILVILLILFRPFATRANFNFPNLTHSDCKFSDSTYVVRVYIFLSPECPLCQSYTSTLKKIHSEYRARGVEFLGVISGTIFSANSISEFNTKYQITFPITVDPEKTLAKKLNATITPQAVVIDNQGYILYSGRIDDWAYALGKKRKHVTDHSLINALEDITHSRPVTQALTQAIGCFLE